MGCNLTSSAYCPITIIVSIISNCSAGNYSQSHLEKTFGKKCTGAVFKNLLHFETHTYVAGNKGKLQLLTPTGNICTRFSSTWKLKSKQLTIQSGFFMLISQRPPVHSPPPSQIWGISQAYCFRADFSSPPPFWCVCVCVKFWCVWWKFRWAAFVVRKFWA